MANQGVAAAGGGVLWLADAREFEEIIRAAAAHHGMLPDLVRKDYWVTRVLRAVATDPILSRQVLFKGGTSLSKGWRLIDRFSEDVDLLTTGPDFSSPPDTRGGRERLFRALHARIEAETPLRLPTKSDSWFYVHGNYKLELRFPLPGKAAARDAANTEWVWVEAGFRGEANPHERRELSSLVAEFVATQAPVAALQPYGADLAPFEMELLRPVRTFAEKLFLLHAKMIDGSEGAEMVPIRHYYDLVQLYGRSDDVRQALSEHTIDGLVREAAEISNKYFGGHFDVARLSVAESPALTPTDQQARILRRKYDDPNEAQLYYRARPTFDEVLAALGEIKAALAPADSR